MLNLKVRKQTVLRRSVFFLNTLSKQMANKHMKVGSTTVVIRKIKCILKPQ